MRYPEVRPRRLRLGPKRRDLVRETTLKPSDLVLPYFVVEGKNVREPVKSMPGVFHLSTDRLVRDVRETADIGIRAILLFGVTGKKDALGSEAYSPRGVVPRAIGAIRKANIDVVIMTDVCLCGYTSHGHCGVISRLRAKAATATARGRPSQDKVVVDEDRTLENLSRTALVHAQAGADIVAPSAMMDGQVLTIRKRLDENGFQEVAICAYSAKYASGFYGPFRDAAGSAPKFGDRKSYQMDPANVLEALREARLDVEEGADIVMVKPARSYLDVIAAVKRSLEVPVAAYNVSGEYAMVKAAARLGLVDEETVALEILTSIKRAGADIIITYFAKDAAKWLK